VDRLHSGTRRVGARWGRALAAGRRGAQRSRAPGAAESSGAFRHERGGAHGGSG
jgi:hypothetical protein